ncbi:hypothetical protein RvY_18497 [Ramazzottius varieornatus]|uniref:ZZ-type domain-containing protein n=1 Tax=Ramazzottius varieornatus TaxID=947166 RepID=A0A1D1WBB5_RAMVA|nr:hypothetical protein RvY_18497 [Ramazzottius varieornatus]
MAFQVKLFVDADQEIRRFNLDTAANYAALRQRVQELLGNDTFKMFWRDSDNDMVVLGSDDELQAARQSMKTNAPLRIFVRAVKKPTCSEKKVHQCVACDGCGGDVAGTRYKCLQCADYDLCEECERKDVHPQHNMMAIRNADSKEWRAFFHGARHHGHHVAAEGAGAPSVGPQGPAGMSGWGRRGGPCGPRSCGPRPAMGGRCGAFQRGAGAFVPHFLRPFIVAQEGKEVNWEQVSDIIGNIAQQFFGALKAEEQADKKENVDSSSHAPTESSSTGTASVQRERADSVAESVKPDKEQEWTHLQAEPVADTTKVRRASLDKTTPSPTTGATNAAPTEADLKDQRIETALKAMAEMGFNNEGDLLRRLLNNYNGDLARVLDSIK